MNQHEFDQDWDLSEGLEPDGPSAADLDRFGSEMMACPACGALMYDQAERCPECGEYVIEEPKRLSAWAVVLMIVLIAVVIGLVRM
ncbi:MAG: hypothetical protein ACWA5W_11005 [Phycisphaerales bacterium]